MPEDRRNDDVEKILADQKAIEDRKKGLIEELLRQKADAIKSFDEKLAKLGYHAQDGTGRSKRSHHKQARPADAPAKAKA